ncbi:MAG: hypothetical protein CMB24_01615 [Euryarchaeota archaeon]|nr:hypothetical protein [Euryarchaeota archaeon]|tara:strand:- start:509 stop:793 length:285 start_codon:yes stop_codon:yes gene_type:complete
MPSIEQRESVKKAVKLQKNRSEFMNYLYDRSGRHDLPHAHPHATFTGLSDELALELGREIVSDMADKWHIKNVRDGLEIRDNSKKVEIKDETKN